MECAKQLEMRQKQCAILDWQDMIGEVFEAKVMATTTENSTVVRTGRGLTVCGTRLTLYLLYDLISAGCTDEEVLASFPQINQQQLNDIREYIEKNKAEFIAEYERIVKQDEEEEKYWRKKEREREAKNAGMPRDPAKKALYDKLDEQKRRRAAMNEDTV